MTGVTFLALELAGKRLELLKEAVRKISRVAVLANPEHPGENRELEETRAAARNLGLTLPYVEVKSPADFDKAFDAIRKEQAEGLLVFPEILTMVTGNGLRSSRRRTGSRACSDGEFTLTREA